MAKINAVYKYKYYNNKHNNNNNNNKGVRGHEARTCTSVCQVEAAEGMTQEGSRRHQEVVAPTVAERSRAGDDGGKDGLQGAAPGGAGHPYPTIQRSYHFPGGLLTKGIEEVDMQFARQSRECINPWGTC